MKERSELERRLAGRQGGIVVVCTSLRKRAPQRYSAVRRLRQPQLDIGEDCFREKRRLNTQTLGLVGRRCDDKKYMDSSQT